LTASLTFHTLIAKEAYPEYESKIKYYLAKTLYELGMFHGAQHYYMEVVRKGPSNPYFKHALPRLAAIAEHTGNDYELLRIVDKIPPESYPRQARPHLYYLMGRKMYEDGELSDAAAYFSQVPASSDLYLRAQYFEGVIHHQRGKLQSAVKAFREVIKTEPAVTRAQVAADLDNLKDLSIVNIGRIYFGLQRYDNADSYYSRVQRDSVYWAESLFERSWTNFYQSDLNQALGLLLTVDSPYYSDTEFLPEIVYLRALTYFNFCEYKEVERIIGNFDYKYKPIHAEMRAFLERYKTDEGRRLPDQAFDTYFGAAGAETNLPRSLFSRILRNRDLSALLSHMDIMDEEVAFIDTQKARWRDDIGEELKKVIERDRLRYKKRAGQVFLQAMLHQYRIVDGLLQDGDVLKFEVVDAQRVDYEFQVGNPDVDSLADRKIDFAVSKEIIYWPFNGEFWEDELGYYRYTEQGACK
jgi:tetratricopeptide (TPR) repeat protein